jgi:hypothetical protein
LITHNDRDRCLFDLLQPVTAQWKRIGNTKI